MKYLMIAALAVLVAASSAQSYTTQNGTMTVYSGPWKLRKSTGDKTVDRMWFIMDRTLNASEAATLRDMFRNMPGNTSYTLQKAMINAIDNNAKNVANYGVWSSSDWYSDNGMSDIQVYDAMNAGLSWDERGALHNWMFNATPSQMSAVAKVVRAGGWANTMWTTSPLNSGG